MTRADWIKLKKLRDWLASIPEINSYQGQHISIKEASDKSVLTLDEILKKSPYIICELEEI